MNRCRFAMFVGSAVVFAVPLAATSAAEPNAPPDIRPHRTEIPPELFKHVHPAVRYVRVEVPERDNLYPLLRQAVTAVEPFDAFLEKQRTDVASVHEAPEYKYFLSPKGDFPKGEPGRLLRDWIDRNRDVIRILDQAEHRRKLQYPLPRLLNWYNDLNRNDDGFGGISRWRDAVRLRALRAKMFLADNDPNAAIAELQHMLSLGQVVTEGEGYMIHRLIGQVMQIAALEVLGEAACTTSWRDEHFRAMDQALSKHVPSSSSIKDVYRVESCVFFLTELDTIPSEPLDDLAAAYGRQFLWMGDFLNNDNVATKADLIALLDGHPNPLDKVETVRLMTGLVAQLIDDVDRPYPARRRELGRDLKKEVAAWPRYLQPYSFSLSGDDTKVKPPDEEQLKEARLALRKVSNPLGKSIVSNIDSYEFMLGTAALHQARFALARAVVAIRRYRDRHGRLPENLDAVVADKLLESVPIDPISAKPIGYSRERQIAWSRGVDENDDSGDWDFEKSEGKDLVVRLPPAQAKK